MATDYLYAGEGLRIHLTSLGLKISELSENCLLYNLIYMKIYFWLLYMILYMYIHIS